MLIEKKMLVFFFSWTVVALPLGGFVVDGGNRHFQTFSFWLWLVRFHSVQVTAEARHAVAGVRHTDGI